MDLVEKGIHQKRKDYYLMGLWERLKRKGEGRHDGKKQED